MFLIQKKKLKLYFLKNFKIILKYKFVQFRSTINIKGFIIFELVYNFESAFTLKIISSLEISFSTLKYDLQFWNT